LASPLSGLKLKSQKVRGFSVSTTLSLIRSRGHLPKGGYDVQNGITHSRTTSATTVLRRVQSRCRPVGLG
jgi:hypothetical protein